MALLVALAWGAAAQVGLPSIVPLEAEPGTRMERIERELVAGGEIVVERSLSKAGFQSFLIEARGIELDARLLGPGGELLRQQRFRDGPAWPLSVIAESDGVHRLLLRADGRPKGRGLAVVTIEADRPARAGDEARLRAEVLFGHAEDLRVTYDRAASEEATGLFTAASEEWRRIGVLDRAARAMERIAIVCEQSGELERALRFHRGALDLSRHAGYEGLESELASNVGLTQVLLGEAEQGQELCRQALTRARGSGSPRAEVKALNCLGEVDYYGGHLTAAIANHQEARLLWIELGDRAGLAQTLLNLGFAYMDLGEFDPAVAWQQNALELWEAIGNASGKASSLVGLGRISEQLGEYQAALNSYREAMPLVERLGDSLWQASVLSGLASVQERMGEYSSAAANWSRALELFGRAGVRAAEADVLLSIGEMYLRAGDDVAALDRLEKALALSLELDNPRLGSSALRLMGQAYQAVGESQLALEQYGKAVAMLKEDEDRAFEAHLHADMALAYRSLGRNEKARYHYRRALELSRAARDRPGEATRLYGLARLARDEGDPAGARRHIEDSLRIVESLRAGVASRELRVSYLASIHRYYELHIELLMELASGSPDSGLAAEAFRASERSRARSLLESLSEAGIDVRRGAAPELLAAERRLKRNLDGKTQRLMSLLSTMASSDEAEVLEREIRDLTREYEQLLAEMRSRSPRYAALTQPQPVSLELVERELLDGETLLLEYSTGEERSFLWVVSDKSHVSFELPSRNRLERAAREVYELLNARPGRTGVVVAGQRRRATEAEERYWAAAERLSGMLLGPAADLLRDKRLLIVADGALQYVPFGALPLPGTHGDPVPLVVRHEIVHLPSASALAVLRQETAGRPVPPYAVAVLADPVFDLDDPRILARPGAGSPPAAGPEGPIGATRSMRQAGFLEDGKLSIPRLMATRREAKAIVATAPEGSSLQAVDFAASRELAMDPALGSYRIVHFATHGLINGESPGLSGIMLSTVDERGQPQNGFLGLHDIYNLELPVELVVLSACNTALGKEVRGEGLVGIVQGFMYAGARRVLASLWKVDDDATEELMGRLYHHLLRQELAPAAALRQAQIEMWSQGSWRHPYYWAAFMLQGEWR